MHSTLPNWRSFIVAQNLTQMGKDRQGKLRSRCTEEGCPCDEFEPAKSGVKCALGIPRQTLPP